MSDGATCPNASVVLEEALSLIRSNLDMLLEFVEDEELRACILAQYEAGLDIVVISLERFYGVVNLHNIWKEQAITLGSTIWVFCTEYTSELWDACHHRRSSTAKYAKSLAALAATLFHEVFHLCDVDHDAPSGEYASALGAAQMIRELVGMCGCYANDNADRGACASSSEDNAGSMILGACYYSSRDSQCVCTFSCTEGSGSQFSPYAQGGVC